MAKVTFDSLPFRTLLTFWGWDLQPLACCQQLAILLKWRLAERLQSQCSNNSRWRFNSLLERFWPGKDRKQATHYINSAVPTVLED